MTQSARQGDADYFRTRAQVERRAAERAKGSDARKAHLELASCYDKAAAGELHPEQLHDDSDEPQWSRPMIVIGRVSTSGLR